MPFSFANGSKLVLPDDIVTATGTVVPKVDNVGSMLTTYQAPSARRIASHYKLIMATGVGGGPMAGILDFIGSVVWRDDSGERGNLTSGRIWRNILQTEFGQYFRDGVDIGASQATVYIEIDIWHPITPRKCAREADFYVPCSDFVNGWFKFTGGGSFAATTWTFTSGTHNLILDIVDEGILEAKARLKWVNIALINSNASYELNGNLAAAYYYNGVANQQAGTVIAKVSNYAQAITSRTLDLNQVSAEFLKNLYAQFTLPRYGDYGTDREDPVIMGYMIPIAPRSELAPLSDMAVTKTLHYQTNGAVTAGTDQIVLGYVEPRTPQHTANQLRVQTSKILAAIGAGGFLSTANGKKMYFSGQDLSSADCPCWRLPVRLNEKVAAQYSNR